MKVIKIDDIQLFDVPEEVKSDLRMKLQENKAQLHTKESLIAFFEESSIDYQAICSLLIDDTEKIIYDRHDHAVYLLNWSANGFITLFKRL